MRMVLLWVVYHDIMVGLFGHVQGERRFVYTTRPKQGSKAMQNAVAVKESIDVSDSLLNLSNATEVEVRKSCCQLLTRTPTLSKPWSHLSREKRQSWYSLFSMSCERNSIQDWTDTIIRWEYHHVAGSFGGNMRVNSLPPCQMQHFNKMYSVLLPQYVLWRKVPDGKVLALCFRSCAGPLCSRIMSASVQHLPPLLPARQASNGSTPWVCFRACDVLAYNPTPSASMQQ